MLAARGREATATLSQRIDLLTPESERAFDEWVRKRLGDWSVADIRAFDTYLLEESHFEFVAAVRRAWMRKSLEELDPTEAA